MLGIDSKKAPKLKGIFASELRDSLRRIRMGEFNATDEKISERSAKLKQEYDAVWE